MKKEIADKWIEALPRFKQRRGWLRTRSGHCCLGVLCEVALEEGVDLRVDRTMRIHSFDGRTMDLPPSVVKWAGLKTNYGMGWDPAEKSLAALNDSGTSFDDIAKIIKEHWKSL